ncbi:MAG TPA: hypothetical protein VF649_08830 [Sphingomonas sp.]|jgi:hypothetical protein|uniref:hypothetical protein n=1 Tax=Sphingomonas sp. TaxID=28214 RepID=UPI002EDB97D7
MSLPATQPDGIVTAPVAIPVTAPAPARAVLPLLAVGMLALSAIVWGRWAARTPALQRRTRQRLS